MSDNADPVKAEAVAETAARIEAMLRALPVFRDGVPSDAAWVIANGAWQVACRDHGLFQ